MSVFLSILISSLFSSLPPDCDVAIVGGDLPSLFAASQIGLRSSVCLVLPPVFSSMSHADLPFFFLPRRRSSSLSLPLLSDVRDDIHHADDVVSRLSSLLPLSPVQAPLSPLSPPSTCADLDPVSCTNESSISFASSS